MSTSVLEQRFRDYLKDLNPEPLAQLAADYRAAAFEGGLKVLRGDGYWAIPPALTPVADTHDVFVARSQLAHHLLAGVNKVAGYFLGGAGRDQADAVFAGLSPAERSLVDHTWREGAHLATARADLFIDGQGAAWALEMNATIPAMQGYADIAAQSFILAVARQAGLTRDQGLAIWRKNGSNVEDLKASLLAHLERLGVPTKQPTLAIVARAQDSQSAELAYITQQLTAAGIVAHRCTPEQLDAEGEGRPTLLGRPVDLIYRHVFVRNVATELPFAKMLRTPSAYRILNPPCSQLEVKALFAELSAAGASPQLAATFGLEGAEVSAAQRIPWSRLLRKGPSTDFEGEPVSDLLAFAEAQAEQMVLKRSWGYGGTSVLLADEIDTEGGQTRAREMLSVAETAHLPWREVLTRATAAGGYVLQRKVETHTQSHLVAGEAGPEWVDWYVDISAFTNLGVDARPSGGVRRGSRSRIVNIVGGGGLVPALRNEVLMDLLTALER